MFLIKIRVGAVRVFM